MAVNKVTGTEQFIFDSRQRNFKPVDIDVDSSNPETSSFMSPQCIQDAPKKTVPLS